MAEILDLSEYYIGQIERGERQMSLPVLIKIAGILHVSLDYIVFGKVTGSSTIVYDKNNVYVANDRINEINDLLNKCSNKEINLVEKIIKLIIPYISKN